MFVNIICLLNEIRDGLTRLLSIKHKHIVRKYHRNRFYCVNETLIDTFSDNTNHCYIEDKQSDEWEELYR